MVSLSFVAAGDSIKSLASFIQNLYFRLTNLEKTVHKESGYPAAISGGTWALSVTEVLMKGLTDL